MELKSLRDFWHVRPVNAPCHSSRNSFAFSALLGFLSLAICCGAEIPNHAGTATVKAILGQAKLSRMGGSFTPLGPGMVVRPGDLIQTASGSAVDLHLGDVAGTVRLTESASLVVDTYLCLDTALGGEFQIRLGLLDGEILGLSKSVLQPSQFEIKTAAGIARILEGRFRVDARGRVVVVEGKALFAHVPTGGEPSAHTLTGPPAVYFAPGQGVQPAPKDLQREVISQMRSKLPRR